MIRFIDRNNSAIPPAEEGAFLLVDKAAGWTSFDVVAKVRNRARQYYGLKKLKLGHAGTLDPMATGLLILALGRCATREISAIQQEPKWYEGIVQLGATTATYDAESPVESHFPTDHIDEELLRGILPAFRGRIEQVPPVYSALKVRGKPMYKRARAGEELRPEPREVEIYELEAGLLEQDRLELRVHCSKGTYIRSLAHDLGKALGSGGYLHALRRTAIGPWRVEDALAVEEAAALFERDKG